MASHNVKVLSSYSLVTVGQLHNVHLIVSKLVEGYMVEYLSSDSLMTGVVWNGAEAFVEIQK